MGAESGLIHPKKVGEKGERGNWFLKGREKKRKANNLMHGKGRRLQRILLGDAIAKVLEVWRNHRGRTGAPIMWGQEAILHSRQRKTKDSTKWDRGARRGQFIGRPMTHLTSMDCGTTKAEGGGKKHFGIDGSSSN